MPLATSQLEALPQHDLLTGSRREHAEHHIPVLEYRADRTMAPVASTSAGLPTGAAAATGGGAGSRKARGALDGMYSNDAACTMLLMLNICGLSLLTFALSVLLAL